MEDYGLLLLSLMVQTLLTIGEIGIFYMLIQENRKKDQKTMERAAIAVARDCPHFFGYLQDLPTEKLIPRECFGCELAWECRKTVPTEITIKRKKKQGF